MTLVSLCSRGDDRLGELLVLDHAVGHCNATDGALASLILSPCVTREVAADNHLHLVGLAAVTYGNHRIGHTNLPVGKNICSSIEELSSNLVKHLTLEGDALGKYNIECRDAIRYNHYEVVVVDVIDVAYLTYIVTLLALELKIVLYNSVHILKCI